MNFNLRELQYILKITELRSVTKASEALHISQPVMSRFVHDVEEALGVKIFDRSTNPISLTFAGECYVNTAKKVLLEHENLMKELRDITHHMTGRLRIGTSRDRASFMMPRILPEFSGKYPGIKVEVFTDSGQKLRETLRDGRIDMLILPDPWSDDKKNEFRFESKLIYTEELVLVARAGTVTDFVEISDQKKGIIPAALKNMDFFLLFKEHAIRSFCDKYFRKNRITPKIKMQFASNIACYRMAATGLGVTIVPTLTTQMSNSDDDVDIFSLGENPVTWEVRAFYRKGAYIGEPEQELIRIAGKVEFERAKHVQ